MPSRDARKKQENRGRKESERKAGERTEMPRKASDSQNRESNQKLGKTGNERNQKFK